MVPGVDEKSQVELQTAARNPRHNIIPRLRLQPPARLVTTSFEIDS